MSYDCIELGVCCMARTLVRLFILGEGLGVFLGGSGLPRLEKTVILLPSIFL
jgi:hypothetical protein